MKTTTAHTPHRRAGSLLALVALFGGLAMLSPAAATAQDQVTVVTRSSDVASGRFEDLANGTIYVRVSQNDQRRIPLGNVLVFDFSGNGRNLPEAEQRDAAGDDHLLVMRNGSRSRGRLLNIEGGEGSAKENEPRVISFRTTDGQERRVRPNEVARIYMGRYPAAAPPTGPSTRPTVPEASGPGLSVPATQRWTNTGLFVQQGQMVRFNASGRIVLSGDGNDTAQPAGSGRMAPGAPMGNIPAGALIGRIGNGAPFAIGNQTQGLPMPNSGQLFLGVNDDNLGDNQGEFRVEIFPEGGGRRGRD
jgi:hypothetical protein